MIRAKHRRKKQMKLVQKGNRSKLAGAFCKMMQEGGSAEHLLDGGVGIHPWSLFLVRFVNRQMADGCDENEAAIRLAAVGGGNASGCGKQIESLIIQDDNGHDVKSVSKHWKDKGVSDGKADALPSWIA
jgi:hypothetical protein